MSKGVETLPDQTSLEHGLTNVFERVNCTNPALPIHIVDRQRNAFWKSYPSEIVTVRQVGDRDLKIFCKYEAMSKYPAFGHRGGVPFEAAVYRELLDGSLNSLPIFYGSYIDREKSQTWLFLEYIENAMMVNKSPEPRAMELAAEWIGEFHSNGAYQPRGGLQGFVPSYDADYYLGWAKRTFEYAGPLRHDYRWLDLLINRFETWAAPLLEAPQTLIHGEYYPKNILFKKRRIYPVDWESTAIAPGEIDLASLTDNWPIDITSDCVTAYCQKRWPTGTPPTFERTMVAARLYLHLRWLGDRPYRTESEQLRWRFEQLRLEAECLGCF